MRYTFMAILTVVFIFLAAAYPKNLYKVAHISESVVGVSCPGNGGDPTVITNIDGTLLVSCGTK